MHGLNVFSISMSIVFLFGYLMIAFEHLLRINKTTVALMMGVLCWAIQFANVSNNTTFNLQHLFSHFSEVSQIIFFLLGAMIIVEVISAHRGFKIIINYINVRSKRKLLWIFGFLTFFISAVLDNLTTTIVMVSIMQKIFDYPEDRLIIGGAIVIAANAGGAWSPIGDVTTTMLWIGGKISAFSIIKDMLIPSLVCLATSLIFLTFQLKGELSFKIEKKEDEIEPLGIFILILGVGTLMFVPIFKILTGLPPFMGIIFGLSFIWLFTDIAHRKRDHLKVSSVLSKLDLTGPLFFLGILLAINALETAGVLAQLSDFIGSRISKSYEIAAIIGLASSVVDNIPLVAASIGMYDLVHYPLDNSLWKLIAYCAGTGGSILIIGSAAGVVYMGMEKVDFFSYFKKIALPALFGFFAGIITYLIILQTG